MSNLGNNNSGSEPVTPDVFTILNTLSENMERLAEMMVAVESRPSGSNTVTGKGVPLRDGTPMNDREETNPNPPPNNNNVNIPLHDNLLYDDAPSPRRILPLGR